MIPHLYSDCPSQLADKHIWGLSDAITTFSPAHLSCRGIPRHAGPLCPKSIYGYHALPLSYNINAAALQLVSEYLLHGSFFFISNQKWNSKPFAAAG